MMLTLKVARWAEPYLEVTAETREELAQKVSRVAACVEVGCRVMQDGKEVGSVITDFQPSWWSERESRLGAYAGRVVIYYYDNRPDYLWLAHASEAKLLAQRVGRMQSE